MAEDKIPLILENGQIKQIQSGDKIDADYYTGGSSSISTTYLTGGYVGVTCTVADTYYPITSTNMFIASPLNGFTHSSYSGILTCTVAGTYLINYSATIQPAADDCTVGFGILLNSTIKGESLQYINPNTESYFYNMSGTFVATLSIDDTLKFATSNDYAGAYNLLWIGNLTIIKVI